MRWRHVVAGGWLAFLALSADSQQITAPQNYMIVRRPGTQLELQPIPPSAFGLVPGPSNDEVVAPRPHERVHRIVKRWMVERRPDEVVSIFVVLEETDLYPSLPALRREVGREALENALIVARRETILARFAAQREQRHRAKIASFGPGITFRESFIAANVIRVDATIAATRRLLANPSVRHIEPATGGEPPPQVVPTVKTGRTWMGTDWSQYYLFALSGNRNEYWQRTALFDTGVRSTHTLLAGRVNFARDCVRGEYDFCRLGTGLNPADNLNHGTSSAVIASGNANLGDDHKGVTFYKINSYKVYTDTTGGLDPSAVLRAFAASVAAGDEIIVAEMQADAAVAGAITSAAEVAAMQYGIAVVAAVGNGQIPGFVDNKVRAPANGRNVLAIGGYDASTGAPIISFSTGPTDDGRIKPDILAPVGVVTAGSASDTHMRTSSDTFGGTSCATAFGGGLAAVLYNLNMDSYDPGSYVWLDGPGWIYTHALMEGNRDYGSFDNTSGAGRVTLAQTWCETGYGGTLGTVTFGPSMNQLMVDIPDWYACSSYNQIDAVIWWSESDAYPHQEIDLYLLNSSNQLVASSTHSTSVFQKIRYRPANGITGGQYRLIISAPTVPSHGIKIYWRGLLSYRS
jgi:hypothetical protein